MRLFVFALIIALPAAALPQSPRVSAEDFKRLTGAKWTGTLVYLDYRSNREVSIRSNLTVAESPADGSWVFEYEYPDEPKANGKKSWTLGEGGAMINGERVVERAALEGGGLRVVTELRGKDNDKDALFRYTYLLGPSSFSIRKEVRPEGAAEFFERNRYSWQR